MLVKAFCRWVKVFLVSKVRKSVSEVLIVVKSKDLATFFNFIAIGRFLLPSPSLVPPCLSRFCLLLLAFLLGKSTFIIWNIVVRDAAILLKFLMNLL